MHRVSNSSICRFLFSECECDSGWTVRGVKANQLAFGIMACSIPAVLRRCWCTVLVWTAVFWLNFHFAESTAYTCVAGTHRYWNVSSTWTPAGIPTSVSAVYCLVFLSVPVFHLVCPLHVITILMFLCVNRATQPLSALLAMCFTI